MSTDNREDYLLNILRLTSGQGTVKTTELAKYMGVAPASVTEMLNVLKDEGYVNYRKYKGVSLTEKGMFEAKNLRRKHHIMERYLTDVLDVNHDVAHEGACAFEHAMSEEVASKMCRMIGTKVDGDCETCPNPCDEKTGVITVTTTVATMDIASKGMISHISSNDSGLVKKLISMGFVPGREIELNSKISDKGARVVNIGETTIALDYDMASSVFVDVC